MNFVFLMDPLETVDWKKDTSYILMLGAHKRGHKIFYLPKGGLSIKDGRVLMNVLSVVPQSVKEELFLIKEPSVLEGKDVEAVFIRTDPPFDYDYLVHTWVLDRLPAGTVVINEPRGLRAANEKIWATQFASVVPPTLVSRDKDALTQFVQDNKKTIAKPIDSYGGQSVFLIERNEINAQVIIEALTGGYRKHVILQEYIKEAEGGDKRILLLDGEPLGAILRVHKKGEHRNNIFSGGEVFKAEITKRDKEIISVLKPELKKLGLHFVGIDVIGDYLIEVNVTSPTCLQEMNRFNHESYENRVIAFVEDLVKK